MKIESDDEVRVVILPCALLLWGKRRDLGAERRVRKVDKWEESSNVEQRSLMKSRIPPGGCTKRSVFASQPVVKADSKFTNGIGCA